MTKPAVTESPVRTDKTLCFDEADQLLRSLPPDLPLHEGLTTATRFQLLAAGLKRTAEQVKSGPGHDPSLRSRRLAAAQNIESLANRILYALEPDDLMNAQINDNELNQLSELSSRDHQQDTL
jgi:hypothetical protein